MAILQAELAYFSYDFKKTVASVSTAVLVELRKMANRAAGKDMNVRSVDIVFNTKSEKQF